MANRRRNRRRPPKPHNGAARAPEGRQDDPPEAASSAEPPALPGPPADTRPIARSRQSLPQERFAALDLGTNNCRLLIASPRGRGFRVFDAFSRIVRLGEGMSASGALSEAAMDRTIDALQICAEKIARRSVTRQRCIATQACRAASNGAAFLARVRDETGLDFEIITPAEEARLSVTGCAELLDAEAKAGLIFDIGGGSTEISWVRPGEKTETRGGARRAVDVAAWTSMPIGVVSLSEKFGGHELSREGYDEVVSFVREALAQFGDPAGLQELFAAGDGHYLGTSGTVTSIAGVHLGLKRYRRDAVDGLWLNDIEVREVTERLRAMSYDERADEPCIGVERADLVVCGCAILDALLYEWPATRIRVADRGLREGILVGLAGDQNRARGKKRGRRRGQRTDRPGAGAKPAEIA
ncbi:MAG: Ppx/GppA phosphatase family protein [Pseudomonadota bacterium]